MNGTPISKEDILKIKHLRQTGHSLPEIMREVGRGSSTVHYHAKKIEILPDYISAYSLKQGGSRKRSRESWSKARMDAGLFIGPDISIRDKIFLLIGLYWGEGNKRELNLINSDPGIIKSFIGCLNLIGIDTDSIKIGLRVHKDINIQNAVTFWSNLLEIYPNKIRGIEVIEGKKKGKLKYGMCRVRVAKSSRYFKLLMSLIEQVKIQFDAAVVQRIEQGTPKP